MVYMPRAVTAAMADQVERFNKSAYKVNAQVLDENARLRDDLETALDKLREAVKERDELLERLAALSDRGFGSGEKLKANGRPVLTMKQTANQCNVSIATISRRVDKGMLESVKIGGRIMIYADQSFGPAATKTRNRR